jgi:DNA (cytosine-5)-methyltransferase 1
MKRNDPPRGGPRIGSLFSGYGGLEQGVQSVLGGETAWVSDIDPGACRILAHRLPGVPNLGDVSAVDWAAVEPVDVVTGGFPCQDVSHAGARRGLGPGTRSGLWSRMADAIDHLRPALVIAENVRGLLSADAASDVEPCPWCLGDGAGEPPLRALGAVLADLAELGYDASWYGLRAADLGAPHGRFRVFILAWPAGSTPGDAALRGRFDTGKPARPRRDWECEVSAGGPGGAPAAVAYGPGLEGAQPEAGRLLPEWRAPADTTGDGWDEGRPESAGLVGGSDAAVSGDALADADGDGLEGVGRLVAVGRDTDGCGSEDVAWGDYEPAVRRWERRLGRTAPAPTEPGSKGQPRLSPVFVEWLMGLPAGWVTDVPGLSRNDQLKALGNGVVPQQAAAAVRFMLARLAEESRWAAA